MHIVYVPDSFPQPSETFVINEIDGLLKKGFQISVVPRIKGVAGVLHARLKAVLPQINLAYRNNTQANYQAMILALRYGSQVWPGWRPDRMMKHLRNAWSIACHVAIIRKQNADMILIHFGYDNAIAGCIAAKQLNKPAVLWLHGSDMYTVPHRSLHWLAHNVKQIVSNSNYSADLLSSLGIHQSITVSSLGIDLDLFKPQQPTDHKEATPTFICIARLGHNKNHGRLIKIFQQFLATTDARLWLVGDGPERQQIENLVDKQYKQNIIFYGAVAQEQIVTLMKKAWCKILLSEKEGLGVAFIEAQATGLPCIATRVGGIPEVIEDKQSGFLFDLDDEDFDNQVVQAMLKLINDQALRQHMGRQARHRAEQLFDEKQHVERMTALATQLQETG